MYKKFENAYLNISGLNYLGYFFVWIILPSVFILMDNELSDMIVSDYTCLFLSL